MPLILDATPGGAASNSYLTLLEANSYFEGRVHSEAWLAAADPEAALVNATRLIDAYVCFTGAATTSTQALAWPRTGMLTRNGFEIPSNVIPQELKNATAELALLLVGEEDKTLQNEIAALGITKVKAGPMELAFKSDAPLTLELISDAIEKLLVPSWLCEDEEDAGAGFVFEVLG